MPPITSRLVSQVSTECDAPIDVETGLEASLGEDASAGTENSSSCVNGVGCSRCRQDRSLKPRRGRMPPLTSRLASQVSVECDALVDVETGLEASSGEDIPADAEAISSRVNGVGRTRCHRDRSSISSGERFYAISGLVHQAVYVSSS